MQGRYKQRLSDINSIVNLQNRDQFGSPSTHTEGLQTAEQFYQNKFFMRTKSLEERVGEAFEPELQEIPSDVPYSSQSSSAIVLQSNIVSGDNNKRIACESNNSTKRLFKTFLKWAKALPATDADAQYDILVREESNLESILSSYISISDLRIFSGEQTKS